jgi:hypothetical protein
MSDRENKLRALLERVRTHRSEERSMTAADAVERFKTELGAAPTASTARSLAPAAEVRPVPAPIGPPIAVPQTARAAAERAPVPPPTKPFARTPSAPPAALESPTRYSSQPAAPERPLSSIPPAAPHSERPRQSEPPRRAAGPVPVRAQSVAPGHQPVVRAIEPAEAPRAKTFGELLELTLALRPQ